MSCESYLNNYSSLHLPRSLYSPPRSAARSAAIFHPLHKEDTKPPRLSIRSSARAKLPERLSKQKPRTAEASPEPVSLFSSRTARHPTKNNAKHEIFKAPVRRLAEKATPLTRALRPPSENDVSCRKPYRVSRIRVRNTDCGLPPCPGSRGSGLIAAFLLPPAGLQEHPCPSMLSDPSRPPFTRKAGSLPMPP